MEDADVSRLTDVPITGIEEHLGSVPDISAYDSIEPALQIRSSHWVRHQEGDCFMNRQIEIRTHRHTDRRSLRLRKKPDLESERHVGRSAARRYEAGKRKQIIVASR